MVIYYNLESVKVIKNLRVIMKTPDWKTIKAAKEDFLRELVKVSDITTLATNRHCKPSDEEVVVLFFFEITAYKYSLLGIYITISNTKLS